MLRLLADENFNGRILRALKRQLPDLDVLRVQDTPLSGADDPALLQFAAGHGRVVLTHDQKTLVGYAWQHVRSAEVMPGVIVAMTDRPIGQVIVSESSARRYLDILAGAFMVRVHMPFQSSAG